MKTDYSSISNSVEPNKIEHWALLPYRKHCGTRRAALAYISLLESRCNHSFFSNEESAAEKLWQMVAWPLDWDTRFFGFRNGRLDLIAPPSQFFDRNTVETGSKFISNTLAELKVRGFEFLTAQVDVSDTLAIHCLEKNGFCLADTIVGYELELRNWSIKKNANTRPARIEDEVVLRSISADCFGDRSININRFNSELKIAPSQVREMYELWVTNSLKGNLADEVIVFEDDDKPLGFITIKLPALLEQELSLRCASIPLNAVDKNKQGKGIYRQLVRSALDWLSSRDISLVQIKTQLPNLAVHSCWQTLGARIFTSYYTFHIDLKNANLRQS